MPDQWDPDRYLSYADERGRPFVELLARVGAEHPREVVDLGCGPGNLTALLQRRWPGARVRGVDSSPAMAERARAAGIETTLADVREWRPEEPVDVVVSNAALQWVPDHLALLPRLVAAVRPGGWFAMQVPGNFASPATPCARSWPPSRRTPSTWPALPGPAATSRRRTGRRSARPARSTCGRPRTCMS